MPIYEYSCQKCGAHIEMMQKISDDPPKRHTKCGGKLEKQWSQTSFQLKGAGWYVTDYAGKKSDGKEKADAPEAKADAPTGDATPKADAPAGVEKQKKKIPPAKTSSAATKSGGE